MPSSKKTNDQRSKRTQRACLSSSSSFSSHFLPVHLFVLQTMFLWTTFISPNICLVTVYNNHITLWDRTWRHTGLLPCTEWCCLAFSAVVLSEVLCLAALDDRQGRWPAQSQAAYYNHDSDFKNAFEGDGLLSQWSLIKLDHEYYDSYSICA